MCNTSFVVEEYLPVLCILQALAQLKQCAKPQTGLRPSRGKPRNWEGKVTASIQFSPINLFLHNVLANTKLQPLLKVKAVT